MAQKRNIQIASPRGYVYTFSNKNGAVIARIQWASGFAQKKKDAFGKAQEFVDSECIRYMSPLTPMRTGVLRKSGTLGTVIGSGSIEYLAPYARRQYYEHKTKAKWFEEMKSSKKDTILKGAEKIAGS